MRHNHPALNFSSLLISGLLILIHFIFPSVTSAITPWLLVLSVVVVGIPHGAIDHVIAAEMYQLGGRLKDHLMFYSSYLAVMFIIGAIWIFLPVWGMLLFLLISIYHFGQSDIEALLNSKNTPIHILLPALLLRGVTIIGLIVFAHPEVSLPILSDAMRIAQESLASIETASSTVVWSIVVLNLLLSMLLISIPENFLAVSKAQFITDQLILITLLVLLNPLLSFAIYFSLWHSAGHVGEMLDYFNHRGKNVTLFDFYKMAMPFTLISFAGLFLLAGLQQLFPIENQLITILFILISVLTLPHMIVADRMLRQKRSA